MTHFESEIVCITVVGFASHEFYSVHEHEFFNIIKTRIHLFGIMNIIMMTLRIYLIFRWHEYKYSGQTLNWLKRVIYWLSILKKTKEIIFNRPSRHSSINLTRPYAIYSWPWKRIIFAFKVIEYKEINYID